MYSSSSHVAPSSRDTFTRYALCPSVVGTWAYAQMHRIDALPIRSFPNESV